MRTRLQFTLVLFTVGVTMFGCKKPAPPPDSSRPPDVIFKVPGMY
jgi:hypothetical protein